MSDDRFNLDDDLPDWLKGDDSDSDSSSDEPDLGLSWQSEGSESGTPSPSGSLGVTGELPWRQGASDPDDPRRQTSSIDDVNWESLDEPNTDDFGGDAVPATDDELPDWLDAVDDLDSSAPVDLPPAEPAAAAPPEWLSTDDLEAPDLAGLDVGDDSEPAAMPTWLDSSDAIEVPPSEPTVATDEDSADEEVLPDWLFGEDEPETSAIDDELGDDFADIFADSVESTADVVDEESSTSLKRIASDNPNIRKLGDKDMPRPEDMTYEEWERYQNQQEYKAQNSAQLEIESEVPDWFRDNVEVGDADHDLDAILLGDDLPTTAPPPTASEEPATDSNYVPEWFLGLEAQELDDAPDWVRDATSKTDISNLLDSSAFELPPEEESAPPDVQEEEPDFLQILLHQRRVPLLMTMNLTACCLAMMMIHHPMRMKLIFQG